MPETAPPAIGIEDLVAELRKGEVDFAAPADQVRASFEATLATLPVAPDLAFAAESLDGVPALSIRAPRAREDRALLYLHGGAYIAGSAQGYRGLAGELARAAGMRGFAIDYRLAPEHPLPAAVEDAVAAYRALLDRGLRGADICIAGDSAGGGLTLALLVALRDRGIDLPAGALLISPWADLRCTAASLAAKAEEDPLLTADGLRIAARHYLYAAPPEHPLASPVLADLAGLPPLLIQVGSAEILLDDAVALARAAGAAGVAVELEIWPHMFHVWHAFGFLLAEGRQAVARAGAFLDRCMS